MPAPHSPTLRIHISCKKHTISYIIFATFLLWTHFYFMSSLVAFSFAFACKYPEVVLNRFKIASTFIKRHPHRPSFNRKSLTLLKTCQLPANCLTWKASLLLVLCSTFNSFSFLFFFCLVFFLCFCCILIVANLREIDAGEKIANNKIFALSQDYVACLPSNLLTRCPKKRVYGLCVGVGMH